MVIKTINLLCAMQKTKRSGSRVAWTQTLIRARELEKYKAKSGSTTTTEKTLTLISFRV